MKRALAIAGLLLCACGETWAPESLIENLRVLGVRADPAELKPGESATLTALIEDPSRPGKKNTVLWLGCDPDPFDLGRSACSDPAVLQDPSALASGTGQLPPGVKVIGVNDFATYGADTHLFDALPAGDPGREKGTVGQALALVVGEESSLAPSPDELQSLFARVKSKEVQSVIALFRIKVSEAAARNTNPVLAGFTVAGEPQFPGARVQLLPAEKVVVELQATDASFEPYVEHTPTGDEDKLERINSAWYSTSGRFNYNRVALGSAVKAVFTAPGAEQTPPDPVPDRRTGSFYGVLRDTRGGQTWTEVPFFICDTALPSPKVTSITAGATRADPIVVRGTNLDSLLDVVVNGVALSKGAVNSSTGNWEALAPAGLASGSYPVRVHGRDCSRVDTRIVVTLP